ncbi:HAD hydrolase family protein [Candidatus Lokiarchaeum ossiferum]|uniref:HAD hydrolase family protein n=1 Tax=Candidatus Lokiarchaeum ossiferum TaxID=2951803 RepID=UPI00352E55BA
MNYVFDIDGTLTPSRLKIDPVFETFFLDWIKDKNVYLVTGSDYPKSVEQVGQNICESVNACYNTAGNIQYVKGKEVYRNEWHAPPELIDLLSKFLKESEYPIRAGNHMEHRVGMLNFSIVGRNCTQKQRLDYNKYDNEKGERENFCKIIMEKFPSIEATVGGQISIDIYEKGKNKAQIIKLIQGPIHFFGDKTQKGGNDYAIASQLLSPPHKVSQVENWQETQKLLVNIV